ncbi:hypothetical protein [Asaia prunellae]|uniref:hypothetical protein n=1 Tax=Asaia prunellae TaxID=610245 RepID=UPI00046FD5E9|nr:hypothetical protein [Asaia prunellae]
MRFGLAVTSIAVMGLIVPPSLARTHHGTTTKAQTKDTLSAKPVVLTAQPGTNLDQVARQLNAADLADAAKHNDNPVVLVASAPLSSDQGDMALFVQLQSARLCGSAGCSTSVYLRHKGGWKLVLDSVSGAISVLPTRHNNMHDLQIDKNDRWTWNGSSYQDSITAPPSATPHKKVAEKPKKKLLRG